MDKMVGPLRQVKVRGVACVNHLSLPTYAAYNQMRMRNLLGPWCVRNPPLGRSGAQRGPSRAPEDSFRAQSKPKDDLYP